MDFLTTSYAGLSKNHGITVVKDFADSIDTAKKTVTLRGGSVIAYDKLVVSPGIDLMFGGIEGLQAANASGQIVQAWKAGAETVTLRKQPPGMPKGRGGRAGEFCLGLALALQGQAGVYALAADTDGIDGVEDNAGAFVAPDTLERALAANMKLDTYLDRNDAYGYFDRLCDLLVSGPTYTNVNDFRAILVL